MAVELSHVISQLREELTAAMRAGEGADLRFELGPVELELNLGVDREAGPNAKVQFWVIELGVDAKMTTTSTQRIKLILDPHRAGQPGRKPVITGQEQAGER